MMLSITYLLLHYVPLMPPSDLRPPVESRVALTWTGSRSLA
ncbi:MULTISPECIES: hypothetical protein [unclassified Frankia]